ncbi:hypothetical protein K502DRAFT_26671 [Neoconidiobolus thromboides FSU 785]|nr:hypothetical protein K502DRAFT_26671 [Neoconidiobolus thromboides FSU 785]
MQEIEILPKDKYLHYITLPKNHDIISWSFSTHKKSILFGLFIQSTVNTSSHNVNEINEFSSNDSNNPMNGLGLTVNGTIRSMSSRKRRGSVNSQWNKQDISGLEVPGEEINKNNSKLSIDISHTSDFETGSKKSINLTNGHRKNKFNKGGELIEVLPLKSYDSNKTTIKGEHKVNQPGTYILYFGD